MNRATLFLSLFSALTFAEKPVLVTSIESSDFSAKETELIVQSLGLQIGRPVDPLKVDQGIRKLFSEGKIQTLWVDAKSARLGVGIQLRGAARRRIRELRYTNVPPEIVEEIRTRPGIADADQSDTRLLDSIREYLKEAYAQRGFFQTEVEFLMTEREQTHEVDVEVRIRTQDRAIFRRVVFVGADEDDVKTLIKLIDIVSGVNYTKDRVDQNVANLNRYFREEHRLTSKVEKTQLSFSDDRKSVDLTITVKMGPRFVFDFSENDLFSDVELRELISDEVLSQSDFSQKISDKIRDHYREVGHHFCRVEIKTSESPKAATTHIEFYVQEGPRVRIDAVEFINQDAETESILRKAFFQSASGIISREIFWEGGLNSTLQPFEETLRKMGYAFVVVSSPRLTFSDDKKGVRIYFDLSLGVQTFVADVKIRGLPDGLEKAAYNYIQTRQGNSLNPERWQQDRVRVVEWIVSQGYSDATLVEDANQGVTFYPDKKRASLSLSVQLGQQYRVGGVRIEGNTRTQRDVILREMKISAGDLYDPSLVRQSEDAISLLGLFSRVEIRVNPDKHNKKDLTIAVSEAKPGVGEIGLGAFYEEPRFRLRPFLRLAYRNLFGLNQTASFDGKVSFPITRRANESLLPFIEYSLVVGYRAPYLLDLPFIFGVQMGLDRAAIAESPLTLQTTARIEEKLERKISSVSTLFYRFHRYEHTTTETFETDLSVKTQEREIIGSTGPGVVIDYRDDIFNPTRGSVHSLDVEFADPLLLSQLEPRPIGFVMFTSRNSFYIPIAHPLRFLFFAGFGLATSTQNATRLPTARLASDLALGGQNTIRGYNIREIAPTDKKNPDPSLTDTAYYNVRNELNITLYSPLSLAVFYDFGQLFPKMRPNLYRHGAGIGFRYKTAAGPIVIDFSYGLNREELNPNDGGIKFAFTIGTI